MCQQFFVSIFIYLFFLRTKMLFFEPESNSLTTSMASALRRMYSNECFAFRAVVMCIVAFLHEIWKPTAWPASKYYTTPRWKRANRQIRAKNYSDDHFYSHRTAYHCTEMRLGCGYIFHSRIYPILTEWTN